jgi:hypothetical protein
MALEPLEPSTLYDHVPVVLLLKVSVADPTGVRFTIAVLNGVTVKAGPATA